MLIIYIVRTAIILSFFLLIVGIPLTIFLVRKCIIKTAKLEARLVVLEQPVELLE